MKRKLPSPLVLIQLISTEWTKESRGAPGASARNRVPEVLEVPPDVPDPAKRSPYYSSPKIYPLDSARDRLSDIYYHHVGYSEFNKFQGSRVPYFVGLASHLPGKTTCQLGWAVPPLILTGDNENLQVEFYWQDVPGKPRRYPRPKQEAIKLTPGQWMQIRFNARHQYDEGGWYYTKHVLNVGFVAALTPTIFLDSSPDRRISDLALLR